MTAGRTKVDAKAVLEDLTTVSHAVNEMGDNVIHAAAESHKARDIVLDKIEAVAKHSEKKLKTLIADLWDNWACSDPRYDELQERVKEALK